MALLDCENRFGCTGIALVASIIIGIITAFLQITGIITVSSVFLWVAFGIAVAYLAATLLAAALSRRGLYRCSALPAQLIGILGTVLFSGILLAIGAASTGVIGAIITGALLAFFSLMLTATACLVRCVAGIED